MSDQPHLWKTIQNFQTVNRRNGEGILRRHLCCSELPPEFTIFFRFNLILKEITSFVSFKISKQVLNNLNWTLLGSQEQKYLSRLFCFVELSHKMAILHIVMASFKTGCPFHTKQNRFIKALLPWGKVIQAWYKSFKHIFILKTLNWCFCVTKVLKSATAVWKYILLSSAETAR